MSMIGDKFVVNLDKLECTCRKWTITRIPCCHSLTIMRFLDINIEQHIPHWFLTSTYKETYIPLIYPVNGPKVWEMNSDIDVLPPPKRILPGRPKKKRRLESWELHKDSTQLRQGGTRKRCGLKIIDQNNQFRHQLHVQIRDQNWLLKGAQYGSHDPETECFVLKNLELLFVF